MAKSARASVKKANRSKLRANLFGPAEHARLERMEKKLMDMASQPKPDRPEEMEVDAAFRRNNANHNTVATDGDIDMDEEPSRDTTGDKQKPSTRRSSRVQKRKARRSSTSIIFPVKKKAHKVKSSDKRRKK